MASGGIHTVFKGRRWVHEAEGGACAISRHDTKAEAQGKGREVPKETARSSTTSTAGTASSRRATAAEVIRGAGGIAATGVGARLTASGFFALGKRASPVTGLEVGGRQPHVEQPHVDKVNRMAKTWVLDTDTKGTGARMVPLEDVLAKPEPKPRPTASARRSVQPATGRPPGGERRPKGRGQQLLTPLPPGHVRKKATGEIGRIKAIDAKAGTATVSWLREGRTSTVPISSISRR